jgi:hypothetical protein
MSSPTKPSRLRAFLSNAPRQEEATPLAPATSLAWKFLNAVDQPRPRATSAQWEARWGKEPKSSLSDEHGGAGAAQIKEGKVKAQARALDERERSFSAVPYTRVSTPQNSSIQPQKGLPKLPESTPLRSGTSLAPPSTNANDQGSRQVSIISTDATGEANGLTTVQRLCYSPGKENYAPMDSSPTVPASAFQQRPPARKTASVVDNQIITQGEKVSQVQQTPRSAAIAAAKASFLGTK